MFTPYQQVHRTVIEHHERTPQEQYPYSALASWYYDEGDTACGFHTTYGFASRTLPCGSHVTFSHAGHVITGTVQDRGPYIYDRLFDLNPSLRDALDCPGLCTVRYRYGDPPEVYHRTKKIVNFVVSPRYRINRVYKHAKY